MKEFIRESNLIEGIDSEKEDIQSMKAWNWLLTRAGINELIVRQLQRTIVKNQDDLSVHEKGEYRRINVSVGGRICPDWEEVEKSMACWISGLRDATESLGMHVRFEHIHPFVDGNGRTGRMLFWWHQLKLGEELTLFKASERQEYYKLF